MKKLLCFLIATLMLFSVTAYADEFSDTADIKYSYDEDYDETDYQSEKSSKKYDDIEESYDENYDETESEDVGEEILEKINDDSDAYDIYAYDGIKVFVNDDFIRFDVAPMLINDRTMVPMRAIFEALGAKVTWDNQTQTAKGVLNGTTVEITIGKEYIVKNGTKIPIDSPAVIISDRTLVPVRAIAESFDCEVNWYEKTQVVEIISY